MVFSRCIGSKDSRGGRLIGRVFGAFGGVGLGMNELELADAYAGVDGGGLEVFVAEQLLDVADVGPAFEHVRGAGVAEQVAPALFAPDTGVADAVPDQAGEHVGMEAFAVAADEEALLAGNAGEQRANVVEVFLDPAQGARADGDDAVLHALALADEHGSLVAVEVAQVELHEFAAPHAGGVEELQYGAVAQAERVGDVGYGEDGLDLAGRRGVVRDRLGRPGCGLAKSVDFPRMEVSFVNPEFAGWIKRKLEDPKA